MRPLSLSRPHLIVVIGIPGSGKTTFAEHFANEFKTPFVNPSYIEQQAFHTRYQSRNTERIATAIADTQLREIMKTGQTVIYEDISGDLDVRKELARRASRAGYRPFFIWVQTDSAEASRRVFRSTPELEAMDPDRFDEVTDRFIVPVAREKAVVISGRHTFASQVRNVLKGLLDDPYGPKPEPTSTIAVRRTVPVPKPVVQAPSSRTMDFAPTIPMFEFEDERKPRKRRKKSEMNETPAKKTPAKKVMATRVVKDKKTNRTTIIIE